MKSANIFMASGIFMAGCALYFRTLAPSLLFGDSAEFQTIAYTLGIGHPTGYSIYVLLARLFTLIPLGEIAWRVNLFSAFCAALTVVLVYLIICKLGGGIIPALFGAVVLAIAPIFWKYSSMAEIYTPSTACLTIILFTVLHWRETKNPRWLFIAGLFGGLSLGIHTTVALSGIGILHYLVLSTRQRADWLQALFGATVGIVIFLSSFLLLDSINSPAGYYNTVVQPSLSVWGMTPADFDSPFERFAFLYFPPQFRGQLFGVSPHESFNRLGEFADQVSWSLWLALPGIIWLFVPHNGRASQWREALLLLLSFTPPLLFAATYNVFDYYVYFIPALVILAILIGLGVQAVVDVVTLITGLPRFIPQATGIVLILFLIIPQKVDVINIWRERIPPGLEDWETYFYENSEGRLLEAETIVNNLEADAIVFTDWDQAYSFYYVAHVLEGQTDMSFHETFPQEGVSQFADSAVSYIEANVDTHPIYFSERPSQLANQFKITRAGSGLFRIERK
jgi:hypothetical protein